VPAIQPALASLSATPPLSPPLIASSVYAVPTLDAVDQLYAGRGGGYVYGRMQQPEAELLEEAVASLEGAEAAVAAASGTGASLATALAFCARGDHILAARGLYGGTTTLFSAELSRLGIETTCCDLESEDSHRELRPTTRLVWTETISNPLVRVADLEGAARLAHGAGAVLVVDNTFASPVLCQPLRWGADLVLHSATKYLGGHSDLIAGAVAGRRELVERVREKVVRLGPTPGAFEAWLALRGMQTLELRMERSSRNAEHLAPLLAEHPAVVAVAYAGWSADLHHSRAVSVLPKGCGGMLAFELDGGRKAVEAFLGSVRLVRFAPSLADVATTVSHPATTSHRSLGRDERRAQGIGDGLLRLSVGVEAAEDLEVDLRRGLDAARAAARDNGVER
jgi:cystathionine beta-lyase/cystathionine gamma-synthase